MKALSLFSGTGGFDLGMEWAGFEIAGMCEIDASCRKILHRQWPNATIWEDVTKLDGRTIINAIGVPDIIFGGPPCQPVSVAGRGEAAGDERNMWPHTLRIIGEIRPRYALLENPTGILSARRYKSDPPQPQGSFFGDILWELSEMGYRVGWGTYGACDVEDNESSAALAAESAGCAPHIRERCLILANNTRL